jgi:hypothetical protein
VRGAGAIAEVSGLHGRGVTMREAVVGEYGDGGVTLWVAAAADPGTARGMERAMVQRIRTVAHPFAPTGVRRLRGREVHELTGMGQRHAWFRSGRLVVWVAADSARHERVVREVVARYR